MPSYITPPPPPPHLVYHPLPWTAKMLSSVGPDSRKTHRPQPFSPTLSFSSPKGTEGGLFRATQEGGSHKGDTFKGPASSFKGGDNDNNTSNQHPDPASASATATAAAATSSSLVFSSATDRGIKVSKSDRRLSTHLSPRPTNSHINENILSINTELPLTHSPTQLLDQNPLCVYMTSNHIPSHRVLSYHRWICLRTPLTATSTRLGQAVSPTPCTPST